MQLAAVEPRTGPDRLRDHPHLTGTLIQPHDIDDIHPITRLEAADS